MITDPVALIVNKVSQRFQAGVDYRSLGIYNRRFIAGTTRWSQHAWGNAWDIGVAGLWVPFASAGSGTAAQKRLDEVYDYLIELRSQGVPIGTIIWRKSAHWNHIHVEGIPKKVGTPPVPAGSESEDDEEVREFIKDLQAILNAGGFRDPTGQLLVVDGVWGAKTKHALNAMVAAAAQPAGPHTHTGTVSII